MVLASMYGSSASKAYGKAGTVNAMGLSSGVNPALRFSGLPADSKLEPSCSAPKRAAPTRLPETRNSRRFMRNSSARRTGHDAAQIIRPLRRDSQLHPVTIRQASLFHRLDAQEGPSGRFGNDCVVNLGELLQYRYNLPVRPRISRHFGIAKGDACVTH